MDIEIENYLINSLKLRRKKIKLLLNHPAESRFKNLFLQNKPKKKRKTMIVNPKNVMLGIDKRTSIIIKNIPDDIDDEFFKNIVFNFNHDINFFYIPTNIKTRKKLRVAFVNVLDYKQIVPIYMGLIYKMNFIYNSPNIKMEICYSKVQGKQLLIKRFFQPAPPIKFNLIKNCKGFLKF